MVRKALSPRHWTEEAQEMNAMNGDSAPERKYVDFEDPDDTEAAVERWLTSPVTSTRSPNSVSQKSPSKSWGRHSTGGFVESFAVPVEQRTAVSSPGPTPGKTILRERLRSRLKLPIGERLMPMNLPALRHDPFQDGPVSPYKTTNSPSTPTTVASSRLSDAGFSNASRAFFPSTSSETDDGPSSVPESPGSTVPDSPDKDAVRNEIGGFRGHADSVEDRGRSGSPSKRNSTSPRSKSKEHRIRVVVEAINSPNRIKKKDKQSPLPSDLPNNPESASPEFRTLPDNLAPPSSSPSKRGPFSRIRMQMSSNNSIQTANNSIRTDAPVVPSVKEDKPRSPSRDKKFFGAAGKGSPTRGVEKEQNASTSRSRHAFLQKEVKNGKGAETRDATVQKLSRQIQYDRRQSFTGPLRTNRIRLHIYDLIASEMVVQLPWGCHFPIGSCFSVVNNSLHQLGTGAYHVGVEINGVEYAYGSNESKGTTGVFTCMPKNSPGYQFRTTLDFGERTLVRKAYISGKGEEIRYSSYSGSPPSSGYRMVERNVDGREVLREMAQEYMGVDYDLLRKNCCTFAHDACVRLGVNEEEIPQWFRNLCYAGAVTQDVAASAARPIQSVLSACDCEIGSEGLPEYYEETGFEVISNNVQQEVSSNSSEGQQS